MRLFGKELFIALFGLMAIGAVGGVVVVGYAVVIQDRTKPDSYDSTPAIVPVSSSASTN